jgi:hypothetical protein
MQYLCYAYFLAEYGGQSVCRYLFVKVDNANLLELVTDSGSPDDMAQWKLMLGLADVLEYTVLPYPNPVIDIITIPVTGVCTVEIYDIKGSLLVSEKTSGQDEHKLDVSFLNSGIYMLRIYDGANYVNFKILKINN